MRGVAFQESAVFPVPALGAKALILYSVHCVNRNLSTLKHKLAVHLAAVAGGFAAAGADGFHLLDRVGQLHPSSNPLFSSTSIISFSALFSLFFTAFFGSSED